MEKEVHSSSGRENLAFMIKKVRAARADFEKRRRAQLDVIEKLAIKYGIDALPEDIIEKAFQDISMDY